MSKSVLFLCGSPRGKKSASLKTARYLAQFLDHDYEFVNVAQARLSADPAEAEPAFLGIVEKMRTADAVFWTFGAWGLFVSVRMQYLLDKLFTQEGYEFGGKVAAAVMTSVGLKDDLILDRVRFFSEQLGFGYLGDVSAVGNPFWGYTGDVETTEDSCRVLAGQMNRALADGYVPTRQTPLLERRYLSPIYRGPGFSVDGPATPKDGDKTILVITGHHLAEDPANASVVESIRRYSRNEVEVIALQDRDVGPCVGCYLCNFREEGICVLKDEYEAIKQRLHEVDGIVYVGTCASGMVDCYLKAFLERSWGIAHRPSLKGKYGFAVATGGGPLEVEAARHLQGVLNGQGARCIATLTSSAAGTSGSAATLRRTVEDLDRAMDEGWQIADRFSTRAKNRLYRDLVAENGMALRADYGFYREHKLFDVPSAGGINAILWWLFRSENLRRRMMTMAASRVAEVREKRMEAYLQSGGRLGRGAEIKGVVANTEGKIQ
ncbi:NAD(P)H-dependent oxidoreductase [Chloroflexota bacterium]